MSNPYAEKASILYNNYQMVASNIRPIFVWYRNRALDSIKFEKELADKKIFPIVSNNSGKIEWKKEIGDTIQVNENIFDILDDNLKQNDPNYRKEGIKINKPVKLVVKLDTNSDLDKKTNSFTDKIVKKDEIIGWVTLTDEDIDISTIFCYVLYFSSMFTYDEWNYQITELQDKGLSGIINNVDTDVSVIEAMLKVTIDSIFENYLKSNFNDEIFIKGSFDEAIENKTKEKISIQFTECLNSILRHSINIPILENIDAKRDLAMFLLKKVINITDNSITAFKMFLSTHTPIDEYTQTIPLSPQSYQKDTQFYQNKIKIIAEINRNEYTLSNTDYLKKSMIINNKEVVDKLLICTGALNQWLNQDDNKTSTKKKLIDFINKDENNLITVNALHTFFDDRTNTFFNLLINYSNTDDTEKINIYYLKSLKKKTQNHSAIIKYILYLISRIDITLFAADKSTFGIADKGTPYNENNANNLWKGLEKFKNN